MNQSPSVDMRMNQATAVGVHSSREVRLRKHRLPRSSAPRITTRAFAPQGAVKAFTALLLSSAAEEDGGVLIAPHGV